MRLLRGVDDCESTRFEIKEGEERVSLSETEHLISPGINLRLLASLSMVTVSVAREQQGGRKCPADIADFPQDPRSYRTWLCQPLAAPQIECCSKGPRP